MPFNCNLCEINHIFGTRGVCNETAEVCICPEGFSGEDDWSSFDSCHINEKFREIFQIIVGSIALITCSISVFLGYFVMKKYQEVKRNTKRNRWVFRDLGLTTLCLIGMSLSVAWYEFQFIAIGKVTLRPLQTIPFGLMSGFMVAIICFLLLAWVHTLPSVEAYGELFEFTAFIKKHPNRVYHIVAIGLFYSLFRAIFTAVYFVDDARNFSRLLNFLLVSDMLVCGMIVTYFIVYAYTLKKLLKSAIQLQANTKANETVLSMLENSLNITRWSYRILVISSILAMIGAGISMVETIPHEYLFIGGQFIFTNVSGGMLGLRIIYSYVKPPTTSNTVST